VKYRGRDCVNEMTFQRAAVLELIYKIHVLCIARTVGST